MKRLYLGLVLILLSSCPSFAAEITTAQAGNFSSASTWVGGVVPGSGDNVIILHNVTVDTNATIGNATVDSLVRSNATLTIAPNKKLTLAGNITFGGYTYTTDGMGELSMGAGSVLTTDGSARTVKQRRFRFTAVGESSNWAKIQGAITFALETASNTIIPRLYYGRYVSFQNTGSITFMSGSGVVGWGEKTDFQYTVFDGPAFVTLNSASFGYSDHYLLNTDFRNIPGSVILACRSGQTGVYDNITFEAVGTISDDYAPRISGSGWSSHGSIVTHTTAAPINLTTAGYAISNVAMWDESNGQQVTSATAPLDITNYYALSTGINTHGFGGSSTKLVTNGVWEDKGSGGGNVHIVGSAGGTFTGNIIISGDAQLGAGTSLNLGNSTWQRNTFYSPTGIDSTQPALFLLENAPSGVAPSNTANKLIFRSNIIAAASTKTIPNLFAAYGGSGALVIDTLTHNAFNGVTTAIRGSDPVTITNNSNNINATDPQFADATRNLIKWAQTVNPAITTDAGAFGLLLGVNGYNSTTKTQSSTPTGLEPEDAVTWIRAGFVPTNAALDGSGYAGEDIGALDYQEDGNPPPPVDPVTLGVSIKLYSGTVPIPNLTGLTAMWWDTVPPSGNPVFSTDTESTDENGTLFIDLTEYTALNATQPGFLFIYQHNAIDYKKSKMFGTQAVITEQ